MYRPHYKKWSHNKDTQLEKADLFLVKAVAVAMTVKHRKLSNRPAIPLSA
jgi:hypothetical protein